MDTMKGKNPKLKQRKVIGLGELYESFITALPVLSAIQFMSILAVLYNQIKPSLVGIFPGITLIKFLVILGLIMVGVMILVYKFLIPSIWTFRGKQLYGFESELMDEVKSLKENWKLEGRKEVINWMNEKKCKLMVSAKMGGYENLRDKDWNSQLKTWGIKKEKKELEA